MTKEEIIRCLTTLKDQSIKSHNDTAVIDVKKDSFVFVIQSAIKALEQEPKTGHWIEQIDYEENCRTLICSNCDRPALHDEDSIWKHKFCPHCGARMKRKDTE